MEIPTTEFRSLDLAAAGFREIIAHTAERPTTERMQGLYELIRMRHSACVKFENEGIGSRWLGMLDKKHFERLASLKIHFISSCIDFLKSSQHLLAESHSYNISSTDGIPSTDNIASNMWFYGIETFVKHLRNHLLESRKLLSAFLHIVYNGIKVTHELEIADWNEHLGTLARFLWEIGDFSLDDAEAWRLKSLNWYQKASYQAPTTGRLYDNLALLERDNGMQLMFYTAKSLCVSQPYTSGLTKLDEIFGSIHREASPHPPLDFHFIHACGALFSGRSYSDENFDEEFKEYLEQHIQTTNWEGNGHLIAIIICCTLFEFGSDLGTLTQVVNGIDKGIGNMLEYSFLHALKMAKQTHETFLKCSDNLSTMPYIHVTLVFLCFMSRFPQAMSHLGNKLPWDLFADWLNKLAETTSSFNEIEIGDFSCNHPLLPEDVGQLGLIWVCGYYPDNCLETLGICERSEESKVRSNACLWLGHYLAASEMGIVYNNKRSRKFEKVQKNILMSDRVVVRNVSDGKVDVTSDTRLE